MLNITLFLIKNVFKTIYKSKSELTAQYLTVIKENEILKRRLNQLNKKIFFNNNDRFLFVLFSKLANKFNLLFQS